uniref:Large ribosomal subunit protein uL30 n=1 Tax=uncultured korarchaeote TaxID=161241 RepID=A0A1L2JK78_9CREN|nr:ribosomal protein L30/L7E [uncultured korarchaeote]
MKLSLDPDGRLMAVIRIKGRIGLKPKVRKTLELLRLKRKFYATVVPYMPEIRGMLQVAKDAITFGEIDKETLKLLLGKRGRTYGDKKVDWEEMIKNLNMQSMDELCEALLSGKIRIKDIPGLKPYFRLTPPSGGFKGSTKKSFKEGGETGYRGQEINKLLRRMV